MRVVRGRGKAELILLHVVVVGDEALLLVLLLGLWLEASLLEGLGGGVVDAYAAGAAARAGGEDGGGVDFIEVVFL